MERAIYKAVIAAATGIALGCLIWLLIPSPWRGYLMIAVISLGILYALFGKGRNKEV